MRRTHVIAVIALTLSATVSPAGSTSASTSAEHHRPSAVGRDAAADRALRRADAVLDGVGTGDDATLALRDLARALPSLDPAERQRANALLARPTSQTDPYGDTYRAPAKRTCSDSVELCVHWVSRTSDAPPSRTWVNRTLDILEQTWAAELGAPLNYRRPARDGTRGDDSRFDVYLKDVGVNGVYGYCVPERRTNASRWAASGYCVLDDDFARSQFNQDRIVSLKATAAHEFFHAVQFAYDYAEDAWFMEATATWMEEQVFDEVNDNRQYLPAGQLGVPDLPLDTFQNPGAAHYGNWVFFEYLSTRFGSDVVRTAWRQAAADGGDRGRWSMQAVKDALPIGFRGVFGQYAASNTAPSEDYPEGAEWRAAPNSRKHDLTDADRKSRGSLVIDHLASKNLRIRPGEGVGADWDLRVTIEGPPAGTSPVANVLVHKQDGSVGPAMPVPLDATGDGTLAVSFDVRKVTITLANASSRYDCWEGTAYSCRGIATDDDQRFDYRVRALPPD